MRIVVALGGNAILRRGDRGTAAEQRAAVREACTGLATLAAAGHELVVTHGNGPQVGRLMLLESGAPGAIPPLPLDVLGAETQGWLGYVVQQELSAALRRAGAARPVATVVTQVVVDPRDPAFVRATKPVGPYLDDAAAARLKSSGVAVGRQPDGGWRRLVPSPRPVEVVEVEALRGLLQAGVVPVAAGGGGVPVVREGNSLRGVEAVVDKDLTAALLVRAASADLLAILTDVEGVVAGYGTPDARTIAHLSVAEARAGLDRAEFPPGSMGPKVEAAVAAVASGAAAVIADLESVVDAVAGRAGTRLDA